MLITRKALIKSVEITTVAMMELNLASKSI